MMLNISQADDKSSDYNRCVSSDVSNPADEGLAAEGGLAHDPAGRLGYLLKHAWLRLGELTATALAPYGVEGRELAVLLTLSHAESASQQQAARTLGIDRTTMVALLDALERKGLVARRPDADDRRRNIVELTASGRDTLRGATAAGLAAERQFLAPLASAEAQQLRQALRAVVVTAGPLPPRSGTDDTPGGGIA
jgi:DNA-binding MarR family transcriptional regulator